MSGTSLRIDAEHIGKTLREAGRADAARVREVLAKASAHNGLDDEEMAVLMGVSDPELLHELFATAARVKREIYGNRLVIFAPLYISNLCANDCAYCAFSVGNKGLKRRALNQDEIAQEVLHLIRTGHKRVLLVAGEAYPRQGFRYVLDSIETIYKTKEGPGEVRRVNVNVAPLTVEEFRELAGARLGTYQIFQETYHPETYHAVHTRGPKADYDWRISAMDRAMTAGIHDVGVGVLFGLFDWRWELLALMQHVRHLEQAFGCGPHTVSVPRLEPASGSRISEQPPKPVSDVEFRKLVAILRLAVPYTGIIMSTRETAEMRRESFALGVSQISAGSRTNPGGYEEDEECDRVSIEGDTQGTDAPRTQDSMRQHEVDDDTGAQFSLGDHRELDEVVRDLIAMKYIPSFCTGCYRLGRTGADFMDLAKPGDIRAHCDPNAISTFLEYLLDYGTPATRAAGEALIPELIAGMDPGPAETSRQLVEKVRAGRRDVYC
ncbi:MAG: [FeFe] hydrogenase H-cluster radical SAM maturase HydG [Candidatus Delongbacteria bacterium]